jgi:hypothetical protein
MKRFFTLMMIAAFVLPMAAQSTTDEEFRILQNVYQKDKKEIVGGFLALEGAQSSNFWTVYEDYESKRMVLGAARFQIIKDYAGQYSGLTDEQAETLMKRVLDNENAIVDLKKSYFKKFSKAAGGKNAAKFYQVDSYLDSVVKHELMDQIPFIDELEKAEKTK